MNLDVELEGLKRNLLSRTEIVFVSRDEVGGVNGLLRMGLQDKSDEMRHKVLNLLVGPAMLKITGVVVNSARKLTSPVAIFLIDQLREPDSKPWRLSAYGRELLALAEERAKDLPIP